MTTEQLELPDFDPPEVWKKEWGDMPEFVQERIMPFDEIIVRFKTEQDKIDFFLLLKQKPPEKLQSTWFPAIKKSTSPKQVYVDEP